MNATTLHLCDEICRRRLELDSTSLRYIAATSVLQSLQDLKNISTASYAFRLSPPHLMRRDRNSSATFASKPVKPTRHAMQCLLRNENVEDLVIS